MTFDALYGAGSWAEFQGLFPGGGGGVSATFRQYGDIPDGVLVVVEYVRQGNRVGVVKAAHYADRVVWLFHNAPRSGHLSDMIAALGPWYRSRGCRYMWMGTGGRALTPQHQAVGFVAQPGDRALLDLGA